MNRRTAPLLALCIAAALSGCTSEQEVSADDATRILRQDAPYTVEDEPFSGTLVARRGDQVVFRAEFEDGRPAGLVENFHDNGELARRRQLAWDEEKGRVVVDGDEELFNEDGQRVMLASSENGRVVKSERWCDDGDPAERATYGEGQAMTREAWDCETGQQVTQESTNAEGQPEGEQKAWAPDGTLVKHARFAAGQPEGLQETWHPNGQVATRGSFSAGKPVGRHEAFDDTGRLLEGGEYDAQGARTGLWTETFADRSNTVHYGPDGFLPAEFSQAYLSALLPPQAKPETVAFYLNEGQVKVDQAIPTDGGDRPTFGRLEFPVRDWTYSVVIADHGLLPLLLEKGADINQADSRGRTRLLRCLDRFSPDKGNMRDRCTPAELDELLAKGAKADVADAQGRNALHVLADVALYGDYDRFGTQAGTSAQARVAAIATVAKAGADVNAADAEGNTPLVTALKSRRADLVRALLAAGARADGAGPGDTLAVHWLFLKQREEYDIRGDFVADLLPDLVKAGADPGVPFEWDGAQVTMRELAARHGMVELVQLLDQSSGG